MTRTLSLTLRHYHDCFFHNHCEMSTYKKYPNLHWTLFWVHFDDSPSIFFLSPVPRTMLFYGRRWRWKNCPDLFSLSSTVDARTGSWGCSSTWNTRTFVLAVQIARRQTDRRCYWPPSLVPAGHRAAGRLHTCCGVGGLQRAVKS